MCSVMEKSELAEDVCVRKEGRTVTITPSYRLSPSTSCPALDEEVPFPVFFPRKQSAPAVGAADLARLTSLTNGPPSCPIVSPQIKSHHTKLKKHTKALLPSKPLIGKKMKQKAEWPFSSRMDQKRPSELILSESNFNIGNKKRDRKLSCDLSPYSESRSSLYPRARKLSCDLTISPSSGKQSCKSFLLSLVKLPFGGGRRGSKPTITEECDGNSSDSAESPGPSPVSIFVSSAGSEQRRRGIVDLESIDGPADKNKLSTYNKLLGKSMELVSHSVRGCVRGSV